jgi:hypothetical protein
VSCPTVTMCLALGRAGESIEQWTGQRWVLRPFAVRDAWETWQLSDLSCASASDCLAIGHYGVNCQPAESGVGPCREHALIERFRRAALGGHGHSPRPGARRTG